MPDLTRDKIKRAKKHFDDLKGEVRAFLDSNPYTVIRQKHPNYDLDRLYRVRVQGEPSPNIALVAGDLIHNLRSSLDHLVWRLTPSASNTPDSKIKFPISETAEYFETRDLPPIKTIGQVAMNRIRYIKPYKGGNDLLWALHRLDIIDKHRELLIVGSPFIQTTSVSVLYHPPITTFGQKIPGVTWADLTYPLQDGAELLTIHPAAFPQMHVDPQFTFDVAFGELEVLKGEPVLTALTQLTQLTENIVANFDDIPTAT